MRKIITWFAATAAVVVLLFNYRTSTMGAPRAVSAVAATAGGTPGIVAGTPPPAAGGPPDQADQTAPQSSASGATSPRPSPGTVSTSGSTLVVNGSIVTTQWGPVQVQASISRDRITDVTALQVPGGFSRELSDLAVPRLRSQALAAQSANIDVVSGATQTSEGYRTSLQAALDAVHFKATR
ncbi:FMN-binding protein [Dactylosporangium sp. NPDC048998]|uniref:FMN-binding protein n=1 Tax=Dactylosporangium sp. NPDC048998 TaxID=3363976 RepID=UPI00371E57E7